MADRYYVVHRAPIIPPQPFYDDEQTAVAAFQALRAASQTPDQLVLIKVSEDEKSRTSVDVQVADLTATLSAEVAP